MSRDPWMQARHQAHFSGAVMRTLRQKLGMSQAELIGVLDPTRQSTKITVPNISRFESGELIPDLDTSRIIHDWVLQHESHAEVRAPTPARRNDPETSRTNTPSASTQVHWAITEIVRMYQNGLPDFQIAKLYEGRHRNWPDEYPLVTEQRLRTARAELVTAGRIRDTGFTQTNSRGRECVKWSYVPCQP